MELTSERHSPERFRRWAAISAIGSAIEKKVWVKTSTGLTYPNMYVVLVGPPAAGKGVAVNGMIHLYREALCIDENGHHISPSSMSGASFTDALAKAERKITRTFEQITFNSLFIFSRELSQLLPAWDTEFMATLTDLWDHEIYRQTRRGHKIDFTIENPQVSILAATTPTRLDKFLPEGAWEDGFLSRTILVYSGAPKPKPLFDDDERDSRLYRDLVSDLRIISNKYGKLGFSEEAARSINEWHLSGGAPTPDHPRLSGYIDRRTAHLIKLCIIATLSRADNNFEIEAQDLQLARDWLEEAEEQMPDIFKAMRGGGDSNIIEEVHHFVYKVYGRNKTLTSDQRLWAFMSEKIPSHMIERVVQSMVKSGLLVPHYTTTNINYSPGARSPHF